MKPKQKVNTIVVLGEEISEDDQPKLYSMAENNPEWLAKQLQSIAKAWHDGSIRSAMMALESDLEHG